MRTPWRPLSGWGGVRLRVMALVAAGLALGAFVAIGTGSAVPRGEPPQLYVEAPERGLVGRPLDVFVSVDRPVTVRMRYAETVVEEVTQDLRVSLLAEAGTWPLEIEAEDASGRVGRVERQVEGVWAPEPTLEAAPTLTVGDALAVHLTWPQRATSGPTAADTAHVVEAFIELDGERLPAYDGGQRLDALVALPLRASPGERSLRAVLIDEFGEEHEVYASVLVEANPNPVQELRVAARTLAVVTPEGRELEAATLARAFDAVGPEPRWAKPFLLPLEGRHTSAFGLPRRYAPGGAVSYHLGTDIAAPTGTPILATNEGVVLVAGMYPIKGGLVVLDHGFGVTSLYFHQSALAVAVGDVVEHGEVIGYVGSTGLSTGPHLHWEMRVDGEPTAPLAWVDRRWPGGPLVPTAEVAE